jgi:Flp pilus assembly pilin Flp
MKTLLLRIILLRNTLLRNTRGQDLIEYALMAGFVAVAAGAIMPNIATSVFHIFAKVFLTLDCAANPQNCSLDILGS